MKIRVVMRILLVISLLGLQGRERNLFRGHKSYVLVKTEEGKGSCKSFGVNGVKVRCCWGENIEEGGMIGLLLWKQ